VSDDNEIQTKLVIR